MKRTTRNLFVLILILSLCLVCLLVWGLFFVLPPKQLSLKFYDVGQGDSVFIRTPAGYKIVVDGGPNNKVVNYLDKDLDLWDRKIDLLVLTHPQADHLFGLVEVVKRFKIGKLLISGVDNDTSLYKLWVKTLKEEGINPIIVTQSSTISLSDTVNLSVIWPREEKPQVSDLNEACIVMKVSYGSFDTLLTG